MFLEDNKMIIDNGMHALVRKSSNHSTQSSIYNLLSLATASSRRTGLMGNAVPTEAEPQKQFYGKRWGRGAHSTSGMCYDAPATGFFGLTGIASKPRSISSRMVSFLDAMRFAGCSSAAKGS